MRCAQREASQREEGLREDWSTGCMFVAEVAGRDEQKWQVSCNGAAGNPARGGEGEGGGARLEEWF